MRKFVYLLVLLSIAAAVLTARSLRIGPALSSRPTTTARALTPSPRPSPTSEPLIPTLPPRTQPTTALSTATGSALTASGAGSATPRPPQATPTASSASIISEPASPQPLSLEARNFPADARARIGVGMPLGDVADFDWGDGLPGWYLNWQVARRAAPVAGIRFAPMVRIKGDRFAPDLDVIAATAKAEPGALWLIGNEPDVPWQDNATPQQYAQVYGVLYRAIKAADPTAQVAIGGVSQPTPLRLAYLDQVLAAYRTQHGEEMPVEVWNVHAFILREEQDSWGVGIPPGMPVTRGELYEIADHADMDIFRRQIVAFRGWMAARGQRDKPLIVTEYGVLMPEDYGFPTEAVGQFMTATFDFFLTAVDPELGYPQDEGRLVQAFVWYSVADTVYPTSNLFDPETRQITPVGRVFQRYVAGLR